MGVSPVLGKIKPVLSLGLDSTGEGSPEHCPGTWLGVNFLVNRLHRQ